MRRLAIAVISALLPALVLLVGTTMPASAMPASAMPELRLTKVVDVNGVTAMAARAGTRTLYLAQQDGVVRTLRNGTLASTPALDLQDRVSQDGGERGLLGIAFSPDGERMYLDYTDRSGNTQIDGFTMAGRNADAGSRRNLLEIDQPQPNHNGGQLAFGPDGDLYIGMGDGGGAGDAGEGHAPGGNGQSRATLLGKILRIDPTPTATAEYTVPADNPFVDVEGARPEIWAYGLRNPWRFSFDAKTGDLWIGDVGQNEYEEIDRALAKNGRDAARGDNFGWNRLEGDHPYRGSAPGDADPPVYEIPHDTGACAVVGGFVYRGTAIPDLDGTYFFSDNCDGTIRALVSDGNGGVTAEDTDLDASAVSSFGQANGGALYVASLSDGIYKITT